MPNIIIKHTFLSFPIYRYKSLFHRTEEAYLLKRLRNWESTQQHYEFNDYDLVKALYCQIKTNPQVLILDTVFFYVTYIASQAFNDALHIYYSKNGFKKEDIVEQLILYIATILHKLYIKVKHHLYKGRMQKKIKLIHEQILRLLIKSCTFLESADISQREAKDPVHLQGLVYGKKKKTDQTK